MKNNESVINHCQQLLRQSLLRYHRPPCRQSFLELCQWNASLFSTNSVPKGLDDPGKMMGRRSGDFWIFWDLLKSLKMSIFHKSGNFWIFCNSVFFYKLRSGKSGVSIRLELQNTINSEDWRFRRLYRLLGRY